MTTNSDKPKSRLSALIPVTSLSAMEPIQRLAHNYFSEALEKSYNEADANKVIDFIRKNKVHIDRMPLSLESAAGGSPGIYLPFDTPETIKWPFSEKPLKGGKGAEKIIKKGIYYSSNPEAAILAHELGHAKGLLGKYPKLGAFSYGILGKGGVTAGMLSPLLLIPTAHPRMSEKKRKKWEKAAYTAAGIGAGGTGLVLAEEGGASLRAIKYLKDLNVYNKTHGKLLRNAFGTYAALGIPPASVLGYGLYKHLKDKKMEKKASKLLYKQGEPSQKDIDKSLKYLSKAPDKQFAQHLYHNLSPELVGPPLAAGALLGMGAAKLVSGGEPMSLAGLALPMIGGGLGVYGGSKLKGKFKSEEAKNLDKIYSDHVENAYSAILKRELEAMENKQRRPEYSPQEKAFIDKLTRVGQGPNDTDAAFNVIGSSLLGLTLGALGAEALGKPNLAPILGMLGGAGELTAAGLYNKAKFKKLINELRDDSEKTSSKEKKPTEESSSLGRIMRTGLGTGAIWGQFPLIRSGLTGGSTLYHGTSAKNVPSILTTGLEATRAGQAHQSGVLGGSQRINARLMGETVARLLDTQTPLSDDELIRISDSVVNKLKEVKKGYPNTQAIKDGMIEALGEKKALEVYPKVAKEIKNYGQRVYFASSPSTAHKWAFGGTELDLIKRSKESASQAQGTPLGQLVRNTASSLVGGVDYIVEDLKERLRYKPVEKQVVDLNTIKDKALKAKSAVIHGYVPSRELGYLQDFPVVRHFLNLNQGVKNLVRDAGMPTYEPGKDLSVPHNIDPKQIKAVDLADDSGKIVRYVNKDYKKPPINLKGYAKGLGKTVMPLAIAGVGVDAVQSAIRDDKMFTMKQLDKAFNKIKGSFEKKGGILEREGRVLKSLLPVAKYVVPATALGIGLGEGAYQLGEKLLPYKRPSSKNLIDRGVEETAEGLKTTIKNLPLMATQAGASGLAGYKLFSTGKIPKLPLMIMAATMPASVHQLNRSTIFQNPNMMSEFAENNPKLYSALQASILPAAVLGGAYTLRKYYPTVIPRFMRMLKDKLKNFGEPVPVDPSVIKKYEEALKKQTKDLKDTTTKNLDELKQFYDKTLEKAKKLESASSAAKLGSRYGDENLKPMAKLPDNSFINDQLVIGSKIEKEHTSNPKTARIIASHHIKELPDYYTRLQQMEAEGKKQLKVAECSRKWINTRAEKIKDSTKETYGKDKAKQVAFAIATQQAHKLNKSPKSDRTTLGVAEAKEKYNKPLSNYKKGA